MLEGNYKVTTEVRKKLKNFSVKPVKNLDDIKIAPDFEDIVCVGDKTSEIVLKRGFTPKLIIYDSYVMRQKVDVSREIEDFSAKKVVVENPAGTITKELILAVGDALLSPEEKRTKIKVVGEEDLTSLIAICLSKEGTLVLYGQPNEGLVCLKVDGPIKREVEEIIESMEKF